MTRAEIEAAIAKKQQEYETEHAASLSLDRECQRIHRELQQAQIALRTQQRKVESIVRELSDLDRLAIDADEPQFPVMLNGKQRHLIITRKTPARIYVRFAGNHNYDDWISMKGKTRDEGWDLDIPAFLAWAKEQNNA